MSGADLTRDGLAGTSWAAPGHGSAFIVTTRTRVSTSPTPRAFLICLHWLLSNICVTARGG